MASYNRIRTQKRCVLVGMPTEPNPLPAILRYSRQGIPFPVK